MSKELVEKLRIEAVDVSFLGGTSHLLTEAADLIESLTTWRDIESAPKREITFVCRHKDRPHVQFEALFYEDCEGWEMPKMYYCLHNLTADEPITDYWENYEWMPLPPTENKDDTSN